MMIQHHHACCTVKMMHLNEVERLVTTAPARTISKLVEFDSTYYHIIMMSILAHQIRIVLDGTAVSTSLFEVEEDDDVQVCN